MEDNAVTIEGGENMEGVQTTDAEIAQYDQEVQVENPALSQPQLILELM